MSQYNDPESLLLWPVQFFLHPEESAKGRRVRRRFQILRRLSAEEDKLGNSDSQVSFTCPKYQEKARSNHPPVPMHAATRFPILNFKCISDV